MWEFFVREKKFTFIVVITFILLGAMSMVSIQKESNPEVIIPIVIVNTPFPGASALDVEQFVTNEIEDAVLGVEDTSKVTSYSSLGGSTVVIEFDMGTDIDEKKVDINDAINKITSNLPDDALDPIVENVSLDDTPVKVFALSGPYDAKMIRASAEDLKDKLERIQGLTEVKIIGGEEREIQIVIEPTALDNFGLSLMQVTRLISQADTQIPIGTIERSSENISLRINGLITDQKSIETIVVGMSKTGQPIYVRDIAKVVDGYKETNTIARLTTSNVYKESAISIQIFKKSGGNVLEVVDKADTEVASALETYLPEGMTVEVVDDMAEFIRTDLKNLGISGLETTLLVIIFIYLLLGPKEAVLAGLSIPFTFLMTFTFLIWAGYTLNFLTLFSLILALGILVDASIVMTEGIYANIQTGLTPKKASLKTIAEFKTPLITGTLTTIFAFLPMMMTSGMIGQFIKTIPVTVSIVLTSALFVSLAVTYLLERKNK